MENIEPKKEGIKLPLIKKSPDCSSIDNDADKTGTDKDSDSTEIGKTENEANKFDKPKREKNPDRTGIDTNSDKTKKEN